MNIRHTLKKVKKSVSFDSDIAVFKNQYGGHQNIRYKEGVLLKPSNEREVNFYEGVADVWPSFLPFIPTYYGVNWHEEIPVINLDDLTKEFSSAAGLDVKAGVRFYDNGAHTIKRCSMMSKLYTTTSFSHGLRLTGAKVPSQFENGKPIYFLNKKSGKKLKTKNFRSTFYRFFYDGNTLRTGVLRNLLTIIDRLLMVLEQGREFFMYSCSFLILYETQTEDSEHPDKVSLHLIDFAHTERNVHKDRPIQTRDDDGIIFATYSLRNEVAKCIKRSEKVDWFTDPWLDLD
ncbi:hypothetical protein PCE1_000725 [Barthelona sp. PCE]